MAPLRYLIPFILITAFQYFIAKDALDYASPFVYGMITNLLAGSALFAARRSFKLILNRDTLLFSLFFWVGNASWLIGLDYLTPPESAIISFTMPLFVIPLAIWLLKERSSRAEIYSAVIGFGGIVLFNLPLLSGTATILGAGITLVDAFFWALQSVYLRKLREQDIIQTIATGFFLSFILFGAFSFADFSIKPSLNLGAEFLFLGFISSALNIYLWMAMIKVEKVGRLTTIVFAAPVITLAYGIATTGVIPGYVTLAGVVLIFVGIYASSLLSPKRPAPAEEHDS